MAAPHSSESHPLPQASSIFENITSVGGTGGRLDNQDSSATGHRLQKLQVWVDDNKIRGIQLWLTNGHSQPLDFMYGRAVPITRSYDFKTNETITSLSLWSNTQGTRLGWITFKTSTGGQFDFGMTHSPKQTEYPANVGSGICTGWLVRSDFDIDAFGFRFLRPIKASQLNNVSYPDNIDAHTFPITPKVVGELRTTNNSTQPHEFRFAGSAEVTQTSSWSINKGLLFGAPVSVAAGIPSVIYVDSKFQWEVSTPKTFPQQENSSVSTVDWDKSGTIPPGKTVHMLAITQEGSVDLPYGGTVELTFVNDSQLKYPTTGQYLGDSVGAGVQIVTSEFRSIHRIEDAFV